MYVCWRVMLKPGIVPGTYKVYSTHILRERENEWIEQSQILALDITYFKALILAITWYSYAFFPLYSFSGSPIDGS